MPLDSHNVMNQETIDRQQNEVSITDSEGKRWQSYGCIAIAFIIVGVSLLFGFQLISILYAIISPPKPPLPENIIEVSHDNVSYGVDEWLYETDQNGCEMIDFFIEHEGVCTIPPATCADENFIPPRIGTQYVGICKGSSDFSIFHMRWQATVFASSETTQFQMEREVLWTGSPPVATSTPPTE